jgi:hypothetical protein
VRSAGSPCWPRSFSSLVSSSLSPRRAAMNSWDLDRAIYGQHEARHFGTTRSTTQHDKFWAVPA